MMPRPDPRCTDGIDAAISGQGWAPATLPDQLQRARIPRARAMPLPLAGGRAGRWAMRDGPCAISLPAPRPARPHPPSSFRTPHSPLSSPIRLARRGSPRALVLSRPARSWRAIARHGTPRAISCPPSPLPTNNLTCFRRIGRALRPGPSQRCGLSHVIRCAAAGMTRPKVPPGWFTGALRGFDCPC